MKVQGDLAVCRTVTSKRTDEALVQEVLAGNRQIIRHEAHWASFDGGVADRDIELPDATTLPEGWQQVIYNDGATNDLNVREYNATSYTGTILRTETPGEACEFTLLDNSTAAGVWYVNCLEDPATAAANKFCVEFLTTDFPAAVGDYKELTDTQIAGLGAATHGRGTSPIYIIQEGTNPGPWDRIIADRERMNSAGDLAIRVVDGCEFDGRVCFV